MADPSLGGDRVSDYQPKPGDQVHVTFAMFVDETGQYRVERGGALVHMGSPNDPSIVRIERSLPVLEGTLILAHVEEQGVRLLELTNVEPPFSEAGPSFAWVIVGSPGSVAALYAIGQDWVEIDSQTLREVLR
jgi:hypothetical protein